MARIRTIKPEFWSNARVMECSRDARLLFIGMWNFADDEGRLPCSDKTIKAQIVPGDDVTLESVRRWLDELSSNGLILIYESSGGCWIQVTGWDHQRIDRPRPSKIPAPCTVAEVSTNIRRTLAPDLNGPNLTEPNLSEGGDRARSELRRQNFQVGVGEGEVKAPHHGAKSRNGRFVYYKRGTEEFEAYVRDYQEGTGEKPHATSDGRWFKLHGEIISGLMAGRKY